MFTCWWWGCPSCPSRWWWHCPSSRRRPGASPGCCRSSFSVRNHLASDINIVCWTIWIRLWLVNLREIEELDLNAFGGWNFGEFTWWGRATSWLLNLWIAIFRRGLDQYLWIFVDCSLEEGGWINICNRRNAPDPHLTWLWKYFERHPQILLLEKIKSIILTIMIILTFVLRCWKLWRCGVTLTE